MRFSLLWLACFVLLLRPCSAQQLGAGSAMPSSNSSNSDSFAYGTASNQQANSSASNSFGGNNNSYQYNTEFGKASEYILSSRQIRCEGPRAFVGVWADPQSDYWYGGSLYGNNTWDMRAGAGISMPFGGLNQTCKAMSLRLEQQLRFDTTIGIVNACAGLHRNGVDLDDKLVSAFPELKPCQLLSLNRQRTLSPSSSFPDP
jgi:hypothetical protein